MSTSGSCTMARDSCSQERTLTSGHPQYKKHDEQKNEIQLILSTVSLCNDLYFLFIIVESKTDCNSRWQFLIGLHSRLATEYIKMKVTLKVNRKYNIAEYMF